jgi:hypothetical protein
MLSQGFPRNPGELAIFFRKEGTRHRGKPEATGTEGEQSYEPVVPVKVGNRRASARSGHGTHWREGENKRTYLPKET